MSYPHFPKAMKGRKVVGYMPATGQPKNDDGTLKLVLIYESRVEEVLTESAVPPKPERRRISRGVAEQGALL